MSQQERQCAVSERGRLRTRSTALVQYAQFLDSLIVFNTVRSAVIDTDACAARRARKGRQHSAPQPSGSWRRRVRCDNFVGVAEVGWVSDDRGHTTAPFSYARVFPRPLHECRNSERRRGIPSAPRFASTERRWGWACGRPVRRVGLCGASGTTSASGREYRRVRFAVLGSGVHK